MANDPVNTIAQLWLWRLEAKVLAATLVCGVVALYAVVDIVSGPDAAQWVIDIAGIAAILAVPACLAYAIYFMLSPAAQLRRTDKALARYRAALGRD